MTTRADMETVNAEVLPVWVNAFATALLSDPELSAANAAAAIGRPGQAKELLSDRRVQHALSTATSELREGFREQRRAAVQMIARMMTWDPKDVVNKFGQVHPIHEWPEAARMCLESWEQKSDGGFKFKMTPRLQVLRIFLELFGDLETTNHASSGESVRVSFYGREPSDE